MDNEKKYNEALEKAKNLYPGVHEHNKKMLEQIFPELRESEDERTRKEIIHFLLYKCATLIDEATEHRWVSYLEKQKEQKEIPLMNGDADLYFDNWIQHNDTTKRGCFEEGIRYAQRLQKEQKPKMPPKWLYRLEYKDASCGLWYNGKGKWCFESGIGAVDGCKTKTLPMDYDERYKQDGRDWFSSCSRKEDLLHWYSLEDAKELISKGFVFTRYLATEYHEYDQQTVFIKETSLYREEIDIFELLKQKPAEWSEEDYSAYSIILNEYKQMYEGRATSLTRDDVVAGYNFLKSLRPQPHWKPSEEQMAALSEAVSTFDGYEESDAIKSLYNQLKKLV